MKILFISMLRIGDFFMHLKIINEYHKAHPRAEIHILANDLLDIPLPDFGFDFKIHFFKREKFKKDINNLFVPLTYPIWELQELISKLNSEKFDIVYDLTFQKISGQFLEKINASEKHGVLYHAQSKVLGTSKTADFVKKMTDLKDSTHYMDLLRDAVGLDYFSDDLHHNLQVKNIFKTEIEKKYILLQVLTSDPKKNIDMKKWQELAAHLEETEPNNKIIKILCGPNELEVVKKYFASEKILSVNFLELTSYFESTDLLVTLDTSVKHLATYFDIPIVEISVGSSHPYKTSAYSLTKEILSGHSHCRPCSHSSQCSQASHICEDNIKVEDLIHAINKIRKTKNVNQQQVLDENEIY